MDMFKFKTVIMRHPPESLAANALRREESSVDMEKVKEQHRELANTYRNKLGLKVILLETDENLPDCVFVEDPAVVIGRKALITTPGHQSRRPERQALVDALSSFPELEIFNMEEIDRDARMDGGDVFFTGQEIFVGISERTNRLAFEVLRNVFSPIPVSSVDVSGELHLKCVCSLAGPGNIAVSVGSETARAIIEKLKEAATGSYKYLEVAGKIVSSNCVYVEAQEGPAVVYQLSSQLPHAKEAYESITSCRKIGIDLTELDKVDGSLTCCTLFLVV